MDLVKRMVATQKTVDLWKQRQFKHGSRDCAQLVKAHARHLGHPIGIPRYSSARGAANALRGMGHTSLSGALDALFTRIEPAQVLLGDVIELPGDNGFSALTIALGNGKALGFHQDVDICVILTELKMVSGAWRIG